MNPLIRRLSSLVAKIETTKGTAEALIASDGAYNIYDAKVTEDTDYIQRPQQGTANRLAGIPGAMLGRASFWTDLSGSGATGGVPLWATTFLPACGYINSGGTFTRSLVQSTTKTVTISNWLNGVQQLLVGAVGTFNIVCNNGRPSRINFDFVGKYYSEGDVSQLDPTEPTVKPPRGYETYTIDSTSISSPEVTIDAGVKTLMLEDVNDTNDTGYLHGVITDYDSKLSTSPYATLAATKDWRSKFAASTEMALNLVIGATATNIVTVAASKCQLTGGPDFGEREGAYTRGLNFDINDGFTIAFS